MVTREFFRPHVFEWICRDRNAKGLFPCRLSNKAQMRREQFKLLNYLTLLWLEHPFPPKKTKLGFTKLFKIRLVLNYKFRFCQERDSLPQPVPSAHDQFSLVCIQF